MSDQKNIKRQNTILKLIGDVAVEEFLAAVKKFIVVELLIYAQIVIAVASVFYAISDVRSDVDVSLPIWVNLIFITLFISTILKIVFAFKASISISGYLTKQYTLESENSHYINEWFRDLRKIRIAMWLELIGSFFLAIFNLIIFLYLLAKYSDAKSTYTSKLTI